jgi:hypothetical protein
VIPVTLVGIGLPTFVLASLAGHIRNKPPTPERDIRRPLDVARHTQSTTTKRYPLPRIEFPQVGLFAVNLESQRVRFGDVFSIRALSIDRRPSRLTNYPQGG